MENQRYFCKECFSNCLENKEIFISLGANDCLKEFGFRWNFWDSKRLCLILEPWSRTVTFKSIRHIIFRVSVTTAPSKPTRKRPCTSGTAYLVQRPNGLQTALPLLVRYERSIKTLTRMLERSKVKGITFLQVPEFDHCAVPNEKEARIKIRLRFSRLGWIKPL